MNFEPIAQSYAARLRAAGLRVTQPRLAILEVLHGSTEPMTIEQVHNSLSRADCDLVTVYRCMDTFEAIGLVKRFYHRGGTTAFTTAPTGENVFVLSENGKVSAEVPKELVDSLRQATTAVEKHVQQIGYRDVRGLVEFFAEPPAKQP